MTTVNAIKKLKKNGYIISTKDNFVTAEKKNCYLIEFIDQKGDIVCIRSRSRSDVDDPTSDYSAGAWFDNLSQAIRFEIC